MRPLFLTNTLSRQKELFKPIHEGMTGMYVCGPTVYGDAHLGHARPGVTYDVLFRLLKYLGYKVRYVRNITDQRICGSKLSVKFKLYVDIFIAVTVKIDNRCMQFDARRQPCLFCKFDIPVYSECSCTEENCN